MIEYICIPLGILCHELGHYFLAKKYKMFNGWSLVPFPHIKLTTFFPHRFDYLSGFLGSAIPLPLWLYLTGIERWLVYLLFMFAIAILDFWIFLGYNALPKNKQGDKRS